MINLGELLAGFSNNESQSFREKLQDEKEFIQIKNGFVTDLREELDYKEDQIQQAKQIFEFAVAYYLSEKDKL